MSHVVEAVVLDIEGTTSATGFVVDVLRPYARERLGSLLAERADEPLVARALAGARTELGEPDAGPARIERALVAWLDEDRKATPLKTLQGVLWAEGFARGELVPHFYGDVVPALRRWHAAGVRLYVYSSGSVDAQRAWFGHSAEGDLRTLVSGWYDTANAGPKREPGSYRTIAADTGIPPDRLLFLSDHADELDAAAAAGWRAVGVRRPGEPHHGQDLRGHAEAGTFDGVDVVGDGA
ncbi:acireductone synthase [Streptomyces lavendulae]|uniref:acireductone synthase n=1 Tax=Streptomyces lavendulae TaxID=1914 RepID=UPI0036946403